MKKLTRKRQLPKTSAKLPPRLCIGMKALYNQQFQRSVGGKDPKELIKQFVTHAQHFFKLPGLNSDVTLTLVGEPELVPGDDRWSVSSNGMDRLERYIKPDPNVHANVFFVSLMRQNGGVVGIAKLRAACYMAPGSMSI